MTAELAAAHPGRHEIWMEAGAGHGQTAMVEVVEWQRRVAAWFERHLEAPR